VVGLESLNSGAASRTRRAESWGVCTRTWKSTIRSTIPRLGFQEGDTGLGARPATHACIAIVASAFRPKLWIQACARLMVRQHSARSAKLAHATQIFKRLGKES
jgi:hypothetical protein